MSDLPLKYNTFSHKLILNSLIDPESILIKLALSTITLKLEVLGASRFNFDLKVVVLMSLSVIEKVKNDSSFLPYIIIFGYFKLLIALNKVSYFDGIQLKVDAQVTLVKSIDSGGLGTTVSSQIWY